MTVNQPLSQLDASKLEVCDVVNPKSAPSPTSPELDALQTVTDRMITVSWTSKDGWAAPRVVPYGPIALMPSSNVLHYATTCFEGMKVFRGYDGRLRLFRPDYNCTRMLASATRVSLPSFDPRALLKLIHQICALEAPKWLPEDQPGSSLYIRPTMIGSDSSLGFKAPDEALLYIFLIYWPTPRQPPLPVDGTVHPHGVRLLASRPSVIRAWPGGTGAAKVGANYGPAIAEHAKARKGGFDQILYLYGPDCQITEAGVTNVFLIWRTAAAVAGALQMVTPPVDDTGLILAGNTRRSILELSRAMFDTDGPNGVEKCAVLEENVTMADVQRAADEGRLVAVFVVGTANAVREVSEIYVDEESIIRIDVGKTPHVSMLRARMDDIMFGKEQSDWTEIIHES